MSKITQMIQQLLVVQDCDSRIQRCQKEIDSMPGRRDEIESALRKYNEQLENSKGALKEKQAEIRNLETRIAGCHEKINKLRQQQFEIKTNQEYKALEKEIGHVESEILEIESGEIKLMEESDAIETEMSGISSELDKRRAGIDGELRELDERRQELEDELKRQQEKRAGLVEPVEEDLLRRYERIMAHVKDAAVVPVHNGACNGCHMNLPAQVIHNVKRGENVVSCDFCGRILCLKI